MEIKLLTTANYFTKLSEFNQDKSIKKQIERLEMKLKKEN